MLKPKNAAEICASYIKTVLKEGDIAIDLTAGNGNDTLQLAKACGKSGKVYAFDIQEMAIENTRQKLKENNIDNVILIKDGHENLDQYVKEKNVKMAVFNLGYLPLSDQSITTKPETTISAIEKAFQVLSSNGFMLISIYYGMKEGAYEKEVLLNYLKSLDQKKFSVLFVDYINRINASPIIVIIWKNI